MIYSKLSAWPPGDISRKSFHPPDESPGEPRDFSPSRPPLARVFDIIEIPKAPGVLQFRSVFLPLALSRLTLLHPGPFSYPRRCLLSLFAIRPFSRPPLLYFAFVQNIPRWGGKWGWGLGGAAGKPLEPDNLTEARWDKIASQWLGWCSCGSPYNSAATPSLHSVV